MGTGASVASNTDFSWGVVGNVLVRTIRYTAFFDQVSDSMQSKLPKSRYTDSRLTWVNKDFTLEDIKTTDLETGKSVDFPHLQARFRVSNTDEFESLLDQDETIRSIEENQHKKLSERKKSEALKVITSKCRDFWNYTRGIWVKNRKVLSKKQVKHAGLDCFEIGLRKETEKESIIRFLEGKYGPDKIGEVSHRMNCKLVVEKNNTRPHLVSVRKSSYAEIEKDDRVVSEISEEMVVIVYCWEEVPVLGSDEFVKSEIRKLNKIAEVLAKEFSQKERHRIKSKIL